jgi:PhnB protein
MATEITVMLAVNDAQAAVEFYKKAFGAEVYWTIGGDEHMVAGLAIGGARFFLAKESPEFGTRGPLEAGFTTVRIELFVDDPAAVHAKAIAAGARQHSEVKEHEYPVVGPKPIGRMLQGAVVDPFGHMWLVGRFLD